MKTLFIFFFTFVALLAGSTLIGGQWPDAALVFAGAFAASLTVWTVRQYDREFRSFTRVPPLQLPMGPAQRKPAAPPRRLAA